ncbi:MAG: phosphonate ABC transporter substrate-binding protein [Hyphomicrobiales bacterium]|nr:phosphonate ABC transporter substrate-binding protein [Hyphomicrobiales bacterium]
MFRLNTLTAALAAAVLAFAPASAQDKKVVNFGIISTEATQNLKQSWEPFLKVMSEKTGLDIKPFFASDYAGIIEAQRFKKVDIAWYGNKSGMEAVDRADGEVFAQTVAASGLQGYYSHLIVSADSPYQTLDDVLKCNKSLDFGIGDPNSTSGFLVPMTYVFAAKKIDPKACFKTVRGANHEANALAVANKQVQVAANNSENVERLKKTAPDAYAKIRIIWTSPLIPSDPIVWRRDLDADLKDKIYTFMMTYGRNGPAEDVAAARKILKDMTWSPFIPSSNGQLYPIRLMELAKEMLKVEGDEKIPAEEKKTRLTDLQGKIDAVNKASEELPRL